jgi:hypothetical protein
MTQPLPSLAAFERLVAARDVDAAVNEALRILRSVDETMGTLNGVNFGVPMADMTIRDLHVRFATRFAAAYGDLLTLPNVTINAAAVEMLFIHHRWSDMMFAVSGFQTSAHLVARLTDAPPGQWRLSGSALVQFLVIFSPSSTLEINLDECFAHNSGATVIAALGYLSARICVTERACAFRERLLEWLPGKLDDLTLGRIRLAYVAEIYMHCSYAAGPGKHRIKADLIAQLRKVCLGAGAPEMTEPPPRRARPRIVVVAEHLRAGHSVYRTHSRAIRSLRERFEVIGVGYGERTDEAARELFDSMLFYPPGDLIDSAAAVAREIVDLAPDIVFHLGVGMSNHVIALASLRLAPIQCVSYGHTATTMSPVIDYVILPDDFVGSEDRFSETVLRLPPEAIPYAAPAASEPPIPPRTPDSADQGPVRIAIPASVMKLNAPFLKALSEIRARASRPVEFTFFPLAAVGLGHYYLDQEIQRLLPGAVVHSESPRTTYLERLGACAFFLCPFPYGNMNSIVDAMLMGVPGVCLDGEEAHARADLAIFRRLGLPDELATTSLEAYIAAAVHLIDDADWRAQCRRIACEVDLDQGFYRGDERLFCQAVYDLLPAETRA